MPPVQFIDKVAGVFGSVDGINPTLYWHKFTVPALRKAGDTLLAIIAGDFDADVDNNAGDEWEQLGNLTVANGTITIARRIAAADDAAVLELYATGANTWAGATLLVYRGLDPNAALVGSSSTNIAASTNFVCPSRNLTRYSDLFLGIVAVTSAAVVVTPPAGSTERHDFSPMAGKQIEVFDLLAEATGATGTKTATTAGAQSGIAASIALTANGLPSGKSLSKISPVSGMLGLPRRGV